MDHEELISITEASKLCGLSVVTLRKRIKRGDITVVPVSGRGLLLIKEVEALEPGKPGRPKQ